MGCGIFYWAYKGWLAWLVFVAVACSCVVSLILSLPAMASMRLELDLPERVNRGDRLTLEVKNAASRVAPPYSCRLAVKSNRSGKHLIKKPGSVLDTAHCGKLTVKSRGSRVYDYLGLFFRCIRMGKKSVLILPEPIKIQQLPNLELLLSASWRPKPGGGYSENHEMRAYRPGDKLNQVHWKLTAKTGELIVREPMIPNRQRMLVDLMLAGTPNEMDDNLGRFRWLGEYLSGLGLEFEIRILGKKGLESFAVTSPEEFDKVLENAVAMECAAPGQQFPAATASWSYQIGGNPDDNR